MQTSKLVACLSIPLIVMIMSITDSHRFVPYTIKGSVVAASDQRPLERVYVSAVVGEEEALTDKNGNFELHTWQHLPITVQVMHADFVTEKVVLTDVSQKQVFRLRKK